MVTWINIWLFLICFAFVGGFVYFVISEIRDIKNEPFELRRKISVGGCVAMSFLCAGIVFVFGFVANMWWPLTNDIDDHGIYEYNIEYISENIVYNERFNNGHSVFVNDKEFVCDEAIIANVDDFKIMQSEYVWKNGIHKFFYDHIFFRPETKYQLVIPEKYVNEGMTKYGD